MLCYIKKTVLGKPTLKCNLKYIVIKHVATYKEKIERNTNYF